MILSHRHRFIFIKTEKTAGTSLEIALSRYLGPEDVVTPIMPEDEKTRAALGFGGPRHYRQPLATIGKAELRRAVRLRQWPRRFYNHVSAAEIRDRVPRAVWDGYFKFTMARHPEDRAVSFWQWLAREDPRLAAFPDFLRREGGRLYRNTAIVSEAGRPLVDDFARFEILEADVARIGTRLGLETLWQTFNGIKAKGGVRRKGVSRAEDIVSAQDRAYIEYLCAAEYDLFGYERRSGGAPHAARTAL